MLQWRDINQTTFVIGSTRMAYSDEGWKDQDGGLSSHDYGGYATDRHPDQFSNEEWWGVMRVSQTPGDNTDTGTPRQVYYDLQKEWRQTAKSLNPGLHLLLTDYMSTLSPAIDSYLSWPGKSE